MFNMLIIDDEGAIQCLIRDIFADDAYKIDACYNGHEALGMLKERHYDVIITDIVMPDIDGLTFMKILRSLDEDISQIPILAMSGGARSIGSNTALNAAAIFADDTIEKPFAPVKLKKAVYALLEGKKKFKTYAMKAKDDQSKRKA